MRIVHQSWGEGRTRPGCMCVCEQEKKRASCGGGRTAKYGKLCGFSLKGPCRGSAMDMYRMSVRGLRTSSILALPSNQRQLHVWPMPCDPSLSQLTALLQQVLPRVWH